jgi:hypothetical protein
MCPIHGPATVRHDDRQSRRGGRRFNSTAPSCRPGLCKLLVAHTDATVVAALPSGRRQPGRFAIFSRQGHRAAMSPPAQQWAERVTRDARSTPHIAPAVAVRKDRGADGAARRPYQFFSSPREKEASRPRSRHGSTTGSLEGLRPRASWCFPGHETQHQPPPIEEDKL